MGRWRPPGEASTALVTPEGYARLKAELDDLWRVRRPEVVAALSAAAAEGDRSENAEYIGSHDAMPADTMPAVSMAARPAVAGA